jgi:hypothetical protein
MKSGKVMATESMPVAEVTAQDELAPPGSPPTVVVAPGLLQGEHVVIREEDDTDEDYETRSRLLAAVLSAARTA